MPSTESVISKLREKRATATVDEAAEILGLSRTTAYKAIHDGEIPSIKIGRRRLVPLAALEAMIDGSWKKPAIPTLPRQS